MNPLISIIIPVYNVEKYIEDCITSVITQSYNNLELILVDDGSTDNSYAICESFCKKDGRIKLETVNRGGVNAARNIGIEKSKGEFHNVNVIFITLIPLRVYNIKVVKRLLLHFFMG